MRILIFGGTGMLGHKLWQVLSREFDCHVTFRRSFESVRRYGLFDPARSLCGVDVLRPEALVEVFARIKPQAVLNAVGIVKQLKEAKDPLPSIEINSLLPHRLARLCREHGARLVHVSTDCVFSGKKGGYQENDFADADDLYGRTKFLGEVVGSGCLTLRTSIIGRELDSTQGLVEWFLAQRGKTIKGYTQAVFTGLATCDLAQIIGRLLHDHPQLSGLYQVAAKPINKYDLLNRIRERFDLPVTIQPDAAFVCDRSLDGSRFHQATGIKVPSWSQMIETIWRDAPSYESWRAGNAIQG